MVWTCPTACYCLGTVPPPGVQSRRGGGFFCVEALLSAAPSCRLVPGGSTATGGAVFLACEEAQYVCRALQAGPV